MKLFLEHYGTAILVIAIIGILVIAATPIGSNIKNATMNKVETVGELDAEDVMYVGKYNGKNVISASVTTTKTSTKEALTVSDLTVTLTYEDGTIEDVTSAGILTVIGGKVSKGKYITNTEIALSDKTVKRDVSIAAITPIYVGYNSTSKTLVFSNTEENSAYQECDNKYGDISETCDYTSGDAVPWKSVRTAIKTISFENDIYPTSTAYWFNVCSKVNEFKNFSNLNTSNTTNMQYMFYNFAYGSGMTDLDLGNNFDTSNVTNMRNMFMNCGYEGLKTIDLGDKFDTSNVTNMREMFRYCGYADMTSLNLGNKFDTSNVEDMARMFNCCGERNMSSFSLGNKFDTSKVTDMSYMFDACGRYYLESFSLGDKFDTSEVTDMSYMFRSFGEMKMTSFNLGDNFDTSKVKNMSWMFNYCGYELMTTLDLGGNFDTSNVENMYQMFTQCGYKNLTSLDLGDKFNTSNVEDMGLMFAHCGWTKMTKLDLGEQFNTSNVTNMYRMFYMCGYRVSTKVYLGNFEPNDTVKSNTSNYSEIFKSMNGSSKLYFKSSTARDWVASLDSTCRPSGWNTTTHLLTY